ncbi:MAG: GNAT family N-acetyltransferase [Lactobacillus sp.]|nr:GNAT family N-acetyltransferase [Lactobacillus sp.]
MWFIKKLADMSSEEFFYCAQLRGKVFVQEQNRPINDLDDTDLTCLHVFHKNDEGKVDAYGRAFKSGDHLSFGRVVIAKSLRGQGMGNELMKHLLSACLQIDPNLDIKIEAQEQVVGFYQKFGFIASSKPYIHANTPHVDMIKKAK